MGRGGCRWRPERRSLDLAGGCRGWGGRGVVREEVREAEASMGGVPGGHGVLSSVSGMTGVRGPATK